MYTDSLKQTIGYWYNNIVNAGVKSFLNPLGLYFMVRHAYDEAESNFFNHYAHGATEVWGYLATFSTHGALNPQEFYS
jgi:hypothetical protein